MEVFVLLSAFVIAISHTFAFAFDSKDVSVCAELAWTNLKSILFFILVGELWSRNLDENDISVEILVIEGQR